MKEYQLIDISGDVAHYTTIKGDCMRIVDGCIVIEKKEIVGLYYVVAAIPISTKVIVYEK